MNADVRQARGLHQQLLAEGWRPEWLFSSGPVDDPPKPEEGPVDVAELVAASGTREHRVFAGGVSEGLDQLISRERSRERVPAG